MTAFLDLFSGIGDSPISNMCGKLTLGSLFDGIGGFPLAAVVNGIAPVWASEIEKGPVSITKRHFPNMKHLGDITQIKGSEIEPADIITLGSPCQDLSIAGKRGGLDGERSGLFMEAVRIIKEMRDATKGIKPRFAVWENVPGAFSSNNGEDYRIVIEETAKIADERISIPRPPARGAGSDSIWESAGAVMGDGWSLAWRVLDAQYWGVPQRRRRIFLVADFRVACAGEVLFKPEILPGDIAEGGEKREEAPGGSKKSVRAAGLMPGQGSAAGGIGYQEEISPTLKSDSGGNTIPAVVIGIDGYNQNLTGDNVGMVLLENHPNDSRIKISDDNICQSLVSRMGTGGGNVPMVMSVHQNQCGEVRIGEVANTLNTNSNPSGRNAPLVAIGIDSEINSLADKMGTLTAHESGGSGQFVATWQENEIAGSLIARADSSPCIDRGQPFVMQGFGDYKEAQKGSVLKSRDFKDSTDLISNAHTVRRLTPTECERLQGFPDGWTAYGADKKPISDSARYKGLGNSLALPCVIFILCRIQRVYEQN